MSTKTDLISQTAVSLTFVEADIVNLPFRNYMIYTLNSEDTIGIECYNLNSRP